MDKKYVLRRIMDVADINEKAAMIATHAHCGQLRKYNGDPYIEHPMRLYAVFFNHPLCTPNRHAAVLLHDVVEDTDYTLDDLRTVFPDDVVDLVAELTNPSAEMDKEATTREERKHVDLLHIATGSEVAKVIKMIDRIDNLSDMDEAPWKFRMLYARESHELAQVIGSADPELSRELFAACSKMIEAAKPKVPESALKHSEASMIGPDGVYLVIHPMFEFHRLSRGHIDVPLSFDTQWDYPDYTSALAAMTNFSGKGDPEGYTRKIGD